MSSATAPSEPTSLFDPRVRRVTLAVLTLVALSAFEGLAVAAAMPQVASSLGDVVLLPWVITGYLLFSGVATVAAGALADRVGLRPVFRAAVVVFVVGGVLAGLAPDMKLLIAARLIQGTGAGAVNAVGLTAVGLVYPHRLVGRAFAANSVVWGVMSVAGPGLAGLLLMVASWRWIFLVNLPLGGLALLVGWNAMPAPRAATRRGLRWSDLVLLTLLTGLLLYGVDALDPSSIAAWIGAALAGAVLLWRSAGSDDALLAPRHIVGRPLGPLAAAIAMLLVGGIGTHSFLPIYVRGARHGSTALTTGSILFFVLGWTTGANVGSRLVPKLGVSTVLWGGVLLVPAGLAGVAGVTWNEGHLGVLFAALCVSGLGMGAATNCALALVRDLADEAELGRATAAHQFVRNLGFMLGTAFFGAVMLLVVGELTGDVETVREVLGGADAAGPIGEAIGTGYAVAATFAALLAAGAVVPLALIRGRLAEVSTARAPSR